MKILLIDNLKQFMKDCEMTQSKLSRSIGVAQSAISAWLAGKKEPSIASLWLLADCFNCTIDELVGRQD